MLTIEGSEITHLPPDNEELYYNLYTCIYSNTSLTNNPLTLMSDQDIISLYNINTKSDLQVMRIKNINLGLIS